MTTPASRTTARQRRLPPIVVALALLGVAAGAVAGANTLLSGVGLPLSPLLQGVLTGAIGAVLGRWAALDPWWMVIQLLFPLGIIAAQGAPVPSWVWLLVFLALVAVYWTTFRTQVPLYLSSTKVRHALVPLLPAGRFTFMDVGSGVGGVLTDLAALRADGEYHGIESAPLPWLLSRVRIAFGRHRHCHARWGSFWDADLSQYDVVFAYLSPVPMAALWEKVRAEMKPGSTFISNTFVVAASQPDRTITVDDLHHSTLHVWTMR
jgi:hypothetical protein